jgi:hypothetical protein
MDSKTSYQYNLPDESEVIRRNRTITTYYAQLYQNAPHLYKWAGMAAFASFHIGEKLELWNWKDSGIKSFSQTCNKQNKSIEDDFQVIRILNNTIFSEIGSALLLFKQMEYASFRNLQHTNQKHPIIISAFEKLNESRLMLEKDGPSAKLNDMVWEANVDILWHEQSEVVQPFFNKLTDVFSGAMTLFASFDYQINHSATDWNTTSRFISFMLKKKFSSSGISRIIPDVTELDQRWFWISKDLVKKWQKVESGSELVAEELKFLSLIEQRNLNFD